MPELPSKSRLRHLGERLAAGALTEGERTELETAREHWNTVLSALTDHLNDALATVGCSAVGRLKNLGTIAEKIARDRTSLPRMRDVIGCRVIVDGRIAQQEVVDHLRTLFAESDLKLIDRNNDPREGYRAVHLELEFRAVRAEIQVRTDLQHQWAEVMERLADIYGRSLRYGDYGPLKELDSAARRAAVDFIATLGRLSDSIDYFELADQHFKQRRNVARRRWARIGRVLRSGDWHELRVLVVRVPALAVRSYLDFSASLSWAITRVRLQRVLDRTRDEMTRVS